MLFDIGDKPISKTCQDYLALLEEMCGGDRNAYLWLTQVVQISLVWDHIVDGDPLNAARADEALTSVTTEWMVNPFLRKYGEYLAPTMVVALAAWKSKLSRHLDYAVYRDIPCAVAFVLGGNARVNEFMPRLNAIVNQMRLDDDERDYEAESMAANRGMKLTAVLH